MDDLSTQYARTLDWLYKLEVHRGWDLKLESVRRALDVLGDPQSTFPSLHVAGTNGKGSTSAMAQAVLSRHGLRVGLFTSPHLFDFRERFRIGDERISEATVVDLVAEVRSAVARRGIELTFFELTTVVAFAWFARERVDAAIVEVGLGGRLDATNVIVPRAAAVTTIAFDHERYLGSTLEEIAREKAGILKTGVPAVVGRVDDSVAAVISAVAAEKNAPLRRLGAEFRVEPRSAKFDYVGRRTIRGLVCGLRGRFQIDNAAVALAALEDGGWLQAIPDDEIRDGLCGVHWPGRLEVVGQNPLVVLDGAHNPAGVEALAAELPSIAAGRPVHLVFGVLADKRWTEMVDRLAPLVRDVAVVPVSERRSEDPPRIAEVFRRRVPATVARGVREALARWRDDPACAEDVILIAGSLFLVGEAREQLFRERG